MKVAKSTPQLEGQRHRAGPRRADRLDDGGRQGHVKGVVTFHPLADDLTRVLLVIEYYPKGLFEKTGNIWRAQGRRARLDLKLYRSSS